MEELPRTDSADMLVALAETIKRKADCSWATSGEVRDFVEDQWHQVESVQWVTARLSEAARAGQAQRVRLTTTARNGAQRHVGYAWQTVAPPHSPPLTQPDNDRARRVRELGLGVGAVLIDPGADRRGD